MHREVKDFAKDTKQPSDGAEIKTLTVGSKQLDFPSELRKKPTTILTGASIFICPREHPYLIITSIISCIECLRSTTRGAKHSVRFRFITPYKLDTKVSIYSN